MARKSTCAAVAQNTPPDPAALEGQSGVGKDASYVVGYGRPPVGGQYKPGQSGNPRGRPKGARNVETILRDELFAPVTIVEKGRRKKVPRFTALVRRLMEKGFAGDLRASFRLIELAMRLTSDRAETISGPDLSPDDADLLDLLMARSERIRHGESKSEGEGMGKGKDGGGENA